MRLPHFSLLLLLGSVSSLSAIAANGSPPLPEGRDGPWRNGRCAAEARSTFARWGGSGAWIRRADASNGTKVFASPADQIGHWVELRALRGGDLELVKHEPGRGTLVKWAPGCVPQVATRIDPRSIGSEPGILGDEKLAKLIARHRTGVIYSWSPQMPLSIGGLSAIEEAAAGLKLPLVTVLDPAADPKRAREALRGLKLRQPASLDRFRSIELTFRNFLLHYPSILVFKEGRIVGHMVPGVMTSTRYSQVIGSLLR